MGNLFLLLLLLLCEAGIRADDVAAPMEERERRDLYSAIQGFVGRGWNGSDLYPDPCGWTPIQGVSCDIYNGRWYVTAMSIGPTLENSLDCGGGANFSPPLFRLKRLKSLTLFKCFTRENGGGAAIPSRGWENLAGSLETLEFRSNEGIAGDLRSSLCSLRQLRSLVLVENSLSGDLPPELGNLAGLRRLVISGNNFSGQIPASIGSSMADLLILDLSRNSLTGDLPPSIGSLRSLLKLDLSWNLLSGKIPPELGQMKTLTLLDLRKNGFSGGLPISLHAMASLQEMLLSDNPLGGEIQSFPWEAMAELSTVDLAGASIGGAIPESMAEIRQLRALHLNDNNFSGEVRFSCEFFRRLGRGFSAWGNPNLRYSKKTTLKRCEEEEDRKSKPAVDEDRSCGSTGVNFSILLRAVFLFFFFFLL